MPNDPDDHSRDEGTRIEPAERPAFTDGPCWRTGIRFEHAATVAGRITGDDGDRTWSPHAYRRDRGLQISLLREWAESRGLMVDPALFSGARKAGQEHRSLQITSREGHVERLAKLTFGASFGVFPDFDDASPLSSLWFPLRSATPLQYLRRMALLHEMAPELETRLEGFTEVAGEFSVVISQRHIEPVAATQIAMNAWFGGLGFRQFLDTAWFHPEHNIAVFDANGQNILTYDGLLYPVDVIPMEPGPQMRGLIERAIRDYRP